MAAKKLLIVDDEPGFTQVIADYFKSFGYDTSVAHNLEDAVILFKKNRPKVVLLDFSMPIITGEKFLPILQNVDPLVKAIVVTGCITEEVEERFKGLGYYAFFEKGGLSLEKVRKKVEEALTH